MGLIDRINQDLAAAMREGASNRVETLRLIKNSIKNEQIKLGQEVDDLGAIKVLQREAKQRRDSIEAYQKGGRGDLAEVEDRELEVINSYLPRQLSEEELSVLVDETLTELGATDLSQMGAVIGNVVARAQGKADGAKVSRLVRERLAKGAG
jgi:uncharacterized protein